VTAIRSQFQPTISKNVRTLGLSVTKAFGPWWEVPQRTHRKSARSRYGWVAYVHGGHVALGARRL